MALFVDQSTGKTYDVPDDQAEVARTQYGLTPQAEAEAEFTQGGVGGDLKTIGEEAIRTGAALIPGVDAGAAPEGLTELEPGQVENPLTGVYSEEARTRREVNPIAAGIGNALPGAAAGLLLPGAGALAVAGTLGLDAASGYAQEAVDAELENRDIRGEDVLRNAGLNVAFSLGAMGLGAGAAATLRGGKNLLERAAETARNAARARAGAAEGAELAEAVAEPTTREALLSSIAERSEAAVEQAYKRLEQSRPPKVANNPNAQRAELETILDSFEKSDPSMVATLREFEKGPAASRLEGLRAARQQLGEDSELGAALDNLINREDLWGSDALGHGAKLEGALRLRPPPNATPEQLTEFAAAIRDVRGGEFSGLADQIEQFAERGAEVRAAEALGDAAPEAATKGIDYVKAMKSLDPAEAWRLTKDGADEGLRKLEANTVSDAFQRVDDTLKEDVAMSVKREDFAKGAEKWSPAQIAKQEEWLGKAAAAPEPSAAPVDLSGHSLESLQALPIEGADDLARVKALKENSAFAKEGRVTSNDGRQGITIVRDGDQLVLRDGRHRFTAAKEAGRDTVWGRVVDGATGQEVFQGAIPIAARAKPKGTGIMGMLEGLLDDVRRSKGSSPESGYALGGFASDAERAINQALTRIGGADPVTRNFEIDQLKRSLDSVAKRLGKATQGVDQSAKAFGVKRILEVSDALREGLQSAELFGRNAGLQSETNAAWKKLIDPYTRIQKRMSDFLGREFGNVGEASGNVIRFNPDSVERAMAAFDRNFRTDLKQAIEGIDQMMMARQQSGLSHLDQLAAARADLQRISDGFEFADLLRVAKSKAKEPAAAAVARRALGSGGSGAVAGAVAGGIPGAVLGAGAGVAAERGLSAALERVNLLRPGSDSALTGALRKHLGLARAEQAGLLGDEAFAGTLPDQLRRAVMAVGDGSGEKAVKLAEASAKAAAADRKLTARLMVDPDAARRYLRLVGDVAPALARFQGENETPQQAFAGYRKMLEGFSRDPETMLELLTEEMGDVGSLSPKLQREAVAQATRIVGYLRENMPGQRNVSVVYPNGTPASSMEIRQFALRFTAATDPASVMADARAGRLQKVQVDTLQALWPREYDGLKAEALQALGTGKASTNTRQRLSLLFGFDSRVDPALGPRTRAIVNAARAEKEKQQPAPGSTGNVPAPAAVSKAVAAGNTPGGVAALQLGQSLTF